MGVQYWGDMSLLDGSIELAGNAKNVNLKAELAALDTTPLSTTGWVTVIGGTKSASVDMDLMTDFAAAGVDETEWGYLGLSGVPKSIVTGSADGSVAYLMNGVNLGYAPLLGSQGEIAMAKLSAKSSGVLVRGALIHPSSASRTSSSTGASKQLTTVSATQRLYAALHVISVSGTTPSLTVKVQSDNATGFPSPADQITFTAATARTYQWSSVAGAITDDWFRVSYTISGTNPVFAFAVTVGIG